MPPAAMSPFKAWTQPRHFAGRERARTLSRDRSIVDALKLDHGVLTREKLASTLDFENWITESCIRRAYGEQRSGAMSLHQTTNTGEFPLRCQNLLPL